KPAATDRVAELIARAEAAADQRLAVRYGLVSESIRAKLPAADKKRLAAELNAALAQRPTPGEVLALLEMAAQQRMRLLDAYRGQKTHERTFLGFLDKVPLDEFGEADLVKLIVHLQTLEARRPWQRCLDVAERAYPESPAFA